LAVGDTNSGVFQQEHAKQPRLILSS